jgi:hypothetical protein
VDDAYKAYQDYCKLFNVPGPASKVPFGRYINKKYDLDTLGSSEKDLSGTGKTVPYRYYPGLYQVKSPATAYAEFCLSYNTDVIGNTTDTPINTTDIIRIWINNIDSSKLNNTDTTDKQDIFLSSIVKELEEMYKFIHSCERPEDISYRSFKTYLSVVSVLCEENKSHDDEKNNTDANSSVLEDGPSVLEDVSFVVEEENNQQKFTLKSDISDALPRSNVGEKVTDKNNPLQNDYVIIRFKTDYESDWHGIMRQFKEGEIVETPAERAETWIKRGIVEEVSELPPDEPANVESFEKILVATT